jgi:tetratricopeptide (TPR) repeat protein
VVRFTLAVNWALDGFDPRGYHAVNLGLHVLSALALFGVVRRTLAGPWLPPRFGEASRGLALAVAAIWLVHPLQTESVTYVTQRTELLVGLFHLLTLYCAIRAWDSGRTTGWYAAAVAAAVLAVQSKESAAAIPLTVLLYDGLFLSPSFRQALTRHWRLYAGLGAAWGVLLVSLVVAPREQSVGFDQGISAWEYARTQAGVVTRYLALAVWPDRLCLDHGVWVTPTREAVPAGVLVGALLAVTAWGLAHRHPAAFLGAWFFLALAPSSSVVPLARETMAERRMYLPLASVVVLAVGGGHALLARHRAARAAGAGLAVVVVAALAVLTARRNEVYASELSIWADTVAKAPRNHRAHNNLGNALLEAGRPDEAMAHYAEAVRLSPDYASAHNNLGTVLLRRGRRAEAVAHYTEAIRLNPGFVQARYNLGNMLLDAGDVDGAIAQYAEALRLSPAWAEVYNNLGTALLAQGRLGEAMARYAHALDLDPDYAEAHANLGIVLLRRGDVGRAIEHFSAALRLNPDLAEARQNLEVARRLVTTPGAP